MWTFITTCSLAKTAEQMYPFLFTILALYYVTVTYLRGVVKRANQLTIQQIESSFTPLRKKQRIINQEYEKKKKMDLAFYCWNASLSIFSLMGAMHLLPEIVRKIQQNTHREYWCESTRHYDSLTLEWIAYFHISKLFELGDTIFLVLRGKDPIFLHLYHHITVAFISWESMVQIPSLILTGAFINYFIHFFMYLYFALHIYGKVPAWFRPKWITYMQIGQMVVGVVGGMETYYYIIQDMYPAVEDEHGFATGTLRISAPPLEPCASSAGFVATGIILYASYFILFLDFYRNKRG